MDTNVLRTYDDTLVYIDDVCIEEEASLHEARSIYNSVDNIQIEDGTYSFDEAIKKICSTENMPQNIRRSERIQMKLIQKQYNLVSSSLTYEPTLNKTTNSARRVKATLKKKQKSLRNCVPNSLVGSTSQSSNKEHCVKVPERIDGIVNRNGKECVAVKWKRQKYVEYIATENLTDNLKQLVVSYLQSRLLILSSNEENASQEQDHASLERGHFTCPDTEEHIQIEREIPIRQEGEHYMQVEAEDTIYLERGERAVCENEEHSYSVSHADEWSTHRNCTVKNTIPNVPSAHLQKINISSFKEQQKLFIKQSGILISEKNIDVKLSV